MKCELKQFSNEMGLKNGCVPSITEQDILCDCGNDLDPWIPPSQQVEQHEHIQLNFLKLQACSGKLRILCYYSQWGEIKFGNCSTVTYQAVPVKCQEAVANTSLWAQRLV